MNQKVFVTGAFGFIGRYVTDALLEKKYEVIALAHKNRLPSSNPITILKGDICDRDFVAQAAKSIKKCDIFIHLAADIDLQGSDGTILTNCLGTYHAMCLAKELSATHFIYLSSIPVIGRPEFLPVTEEHPIKPETLYHITKYTGEQIVLKTAPKDMQTVILRIPSPVGAGMPPKNYLPFLLEKCRKNETIELYGTGARIQNYIDVRDIAAAIVQSFTGAYSGVFLIAARESVSNRDLAFLCKKITGSSSPIIWGKREDPEEGNRWMISSEKALYVFGFAPKYKLEDTIRWMADK